MKKSYDKKSIEESIVLRIFDLSNQLKKIGDEVYPKVGLTTQQWLILLHLANNPNLPFFKRENMKKLLWPVSWQNR